MVVIASVGCGLSLIDCNLHFDTDDTLIAILLPYNIQLFINHQLKVHTHILKSIPTQLKQHVLEGLQDMALVIFVLSQVTGGHVL